MLVPCAGAFLGTCWNVLAGTPRGHGHYQELRGSFRVLPGAMEVATSPRGLTGETLGHNENAGRVAGDILEDYWEFSGMSLGAEDHAWV